MIRDRTVGELQEQYWHISSIGTVFRYASQARRYCCRKVILWPKRIHEGIHAMAWVHRSVSSRRICANSDGEEDFEPDTPKECFQEASRCHPKPIKAILKLLILGGATLHKMEEYVPILVRKRTSNRMPQNNAFQDASRRHPKPAKAILKLLTFDGATLHKMEEYAPILLGKRTSNRMPQNCAFQEVSRLHPRPAQAILKLLILHGHMVRPCIKWRNICPFWLGKRFCTGCPKTMLSKALQDVIQNHQSRPEPHGLEWCNPS